MKKLILVRHAKSSWKHNVIDHERPLKNRGYRDANLVSTHFKEKGLKIDRVLSSDAERAKTTADIFINNLNINREIVDLVHKLYDFSGENLIETIQNCPDNIDTLMVFGHNHAITAFTNNYGNQYIVNVPTTGVVVFEFEVEKWSYLKPGKTVMTLFPKDLK